VNETLKSLLKLSEVDKIIHHLSCQQEELPQINLELKTKIATLQNELNTKKIELSDLSALRKELLEAVQTKTEWMQSREERINELKTQKEYQAAQKEISLAKKGIKEKDAQLGEVGPKIDRLTNELLTLTEKSEPLIAQHTSDIQSNNEKLGSLDKELEKNTALRTELASNITDKTCLKHYEHIFRRAVPAISRLEGNICTECGTKVLPQSINMLKVGQQMQYCSRCKRILYIESLVFANDTDCPSCEG